MFQSRAGFTQLLNGKFIYRPKIDISNGTQQGLPLSPLIFNLCLEPLLNKINSTINGIIYNPLTTFTPSTTLSNFTKKVKSQAFADDIITFNQDSIDINKTIQIFSEFENISGLKLLSIKKNLLHGPSTSPNYTWD